MKIFISRPILFSSRCALFLVTMLVAAFIAAPAAIAVVAVDLGNATTFAALAGSGITVAGAVNTTTINGDIGSYPTMTITGLENVVLNGTNHWGDPDTQAAKTDLITAYDDAAGRAPTTTYGAIFDLGGLTLTPGVYNDPSSFGITGTLTLDALGDANAVWIFQAGSTLITATDSKIILTGGAQASNIFWQVGTSATLGTNSVFQGTILALSSITLTTGATMCGRALARNEAVTLDTNVIKLPAIPIFWAWYMGNTGSYIYKVRNCIIEPIALDIYTDVVIQPWEAFWFQANVPDRDMTMNFHPAETTVFSGSSLSYPLALSTDEIDFVSFPLIKKDTTVEDLFAGTAFDVGTNGSQFLLQKKIGGVVETYNGTNTDAFKVQAGRGYGIQHHTAGSGLVIPESLMKTGSEQYAPVKLQLSVVMNDGDYRTLNMVGNPFNHAIHLTSKYSTSNVFIQMDTLSPEINGAAKIASGGYTDFVRNMETMEQWHIGLAVADSRGELADTFNKAGVISANGDVDRLIDFYSAEDLILPGKNVRLVLRNPDQLDESKLCYDYRAGGQDSYTWNIELSTTQQTVDAKLSLKNLAGIPADYQILITDPVTNKSIPVTSDTVLDVALSSQSPKTLVLTASRQKSTGVNELSRPAGIKINSIYPNPFNPETTISFSTNLSGRVAVQVYSVTGQLVDTLADRNMSAGSHQINWDGAGHSSGVYIVTVNSGANTETKRMTLLK